MLFCGILKQLLAAFGTAFGSPFHIEHNLNNLHFVNKKYLVCSSVFTHLHTHMSMYIFINA